MILPDGVDAQSVEALRRGGGDPDEKWTRKGRRQIYGAFFHSATPTANPARASWQGRRSAGRRTSFIFINDLMGDMAVGAVYSEPFSTLIPCYQGK